MLEDKNDDSSYNSNTIYVSVIFHKNFGDKKADESELSNGLIKSAKRTGQLNLSNRGLGSVPENVWKIDELVMEESKEVDFARSDLNNWWNAESLKMLDLSSNVVKTISPNVKLLQQLVTMKNMSHNKLVELPPGMGYLVRLVELNLSHNQLQELPPDIVNLRDLKKLNISNNNLRQLPPMGELRKMEILDANHNDIEELPDFYGCTALKEIYLANNYIKEITEEFCDQMQHLTVLNIRDNKVEVLPENVSLLQTLKRLDLTNNNLNKLPKNLGLLSQLQSINMEGNKLSMVRQDVIKGGTDRMMKFLRDRITEELVCDTKVTNNDWPDKYTLKKSQALMLPARDLTSVPEDVFVAAASAEVHIVDISRNKLLEIPNSVTLLRETLSQLILSSNSISNVPSQICCLSHLQFLDLGKNCLLDLPPEIGDLKNVRELVISNNKFTKIPRCVYELEKLEILLAAENQIDEINVSSDALTKLKKLAVLDLSNNSIFTVPPELGNFTHLRSLELMGNCFRQPRHAILAKGTASVLSYLRDRIPQTATN
ncbi:leucine-rich repeat-containing protein 40-like isoform X3 [Achroia grisella]|uniref:leucine-rich repeat-containing protein 40-like isoform X3 n=1 Tax=Achroia grisella TaxID=688607 RepID=UPI0027D3480A|nr:leucine-rich repeat-containing protein 40-like isoform X3 [Achroia grisella]